MLINYHHINNSYIKSYCHDICYNLITLQDDIDIILATNTAENIYTLVLKYQSLGILLNRFSSNHFENSYLYMGNWHRIIDILCGKGNMNLFQNPKSSLVDEEKTFLIELKLINSFLINELVTKETPLTLRKININSLEIIFVSYQEVKLNNFLSKWELKNAN